MEWARGLNKTEAEDLLDWLEQQGSHGQLEIEPDQSFAVRCLGFHVDRDANGQLMVYRHTGQKRI